MCKTCRTRSGLLNTSFLNENGSCTFGCGSIVDPDYGICPRCKEHSANHAECTECGREYEDWGGTWSEVK